MNTSITRALQVAQDEIRGVAYGLELLAEKETEATHTQQLYAHQLYEVYEELKKIANALEEGVA